MDYSIDCFDLPRAVYSVFAQHDAVRNVWFPISACIQVMHENDVPVVDGLGRRGLLVKLNFCKCLEGLIPSHLEEVAQYMCCTIVPMPTISKRAKQLNVKSVMKQHTCHPRNDLLDPIRKTLAEQARCEEGSLSESHTPFTVYNLKWFAWDCWRPWKHVVTVA